MWRSKVGNYSFVSVSFPSMSVLLFLRNSDAECSKRLNCLCLSSLSSCPSSVQMMWLGLPGWRTWVAAQYRAASHCVPDSDECYSVEHLVSAISSRNCTSRFLPPKLTKNRTVHCFWLIFLDLHLKPTAPTTNWGGGLPLIHGLQREGVACCPSLAAVEHVSKPMRWCCLKIEENIVKQRLWTSGYKHLKSLINLYKPT